MSSLLPPYGRILIDTSVGDIEVELWSKECPKACRNLIALALEGYYDGVLFHRVVPGFLVQTGDRSGTGSGGESFYGEPFEDEINSRLRWSHRGLVGCAGNGARNTNDSQFFITLDRADELQNKNTLFGRVVGDTIYNVLKIGQLEIDKDGRPTYPPRINTIRILDNPFDDIVPRITAEERRVQKRAKEEAARQREDQDRRKGAKKDSKLLSFGAEEEELAPVKKKPITRPDLIDDPADAVGLAMMTAPPVAPPKAKVSLVKEDEQPEKMDKPKKGSKKVADDVDDVLGIRARHAKEQAAEKESRQVTIQSLEASVRSLTKRRSRSPSPVEDPNKRRKGQSALAQELAKYESQRGVAARSTKSKGKARRGEDDILNALSSFSSRLHRAKSEEGEDIADMEEAPPAGEPTGDEDPGEELDTDRDFLGHYLKFDHGNEEETRRAEADYEVIDPRARARWAKEEKRDDRRDRRRGGRR